MSEFSSAEMFNLGLIQLMVRLQLYQKYSLLCPYIMHGSLRQGFPSLALQLLLRHF